MHLAGEYFKQQTQTAYEHVPYSGGSQATVSLLAGTTLFSITNIPNVLSQIQAGKLKGLAHITGGGLVDNLPRVLPNDCDAVIDLASWKVPRIFQLLQEGGRVPRDEMYQVFNMGIGMVAIVAPNDAAAVAKQLRAKVIGRIERGARATRLSS